MQSPAQVGNRPSNAQTLCHLVPHPPEGLTEESPSPSPRDSTDTRAKKLRASFCVFPVLGSNNRLRPLQPADTWPCSRPSLSGRETAICGACHGPTLGCLPDTSSADGEPDSTVVTNLPTVTHPVPGGTRTGTRFCLAGPNQGYSVLHPLASERVSHWALAVLQALSPRRLS